MTELVVEGLGVEGKERGGEYFDEAGFGKVNLEDEDLNLSVSSTALD